MPKYTFECQRCTLRFSRMLKMDEHPTFECPTCKDEAPRLFEGFGFGFAPGGGADANSGVHDHDYPSADKVVGRSAEQRWGEYRERDKVKKKAREMGDTHALIRVDGDGFTDYEPMTPVGTDARAKLVDHAVALERQPVVKP